MLVDFRTAIAHQPRDCTRVRALRRPLLRTPPIPRASQIPSIQARWTRPNPALRPTRPLAGMTCLY